jgi:hypothetical protein
MPPDGLRKIEVGYIIRSDPRLQDLACFLFHGPAVTGCTDAEPELNRVIQASYC